uniref:Uncharacterized protein n=1 Tax=Megaselia scalaris TaxID=36166 RepID=T1GRH6_MEGSC
MCFYNVQHDASDMNTERNSGLSTLPQYVFNIFSKYKWIVTVDQFLRIESNSFYAVYPLCKADALHTKLRALPLVNYLLNF